MPVINFTGLASGLDTRALVDAILTFERRPLERLQERQALFSQKLAALGELRSKLGSFETALRDLTSDRTFRGRSSTVSDTSILRATAASKADTGIFEIKVTNLAVGHKVRGNEVVATDQGLIADGTITIQSGSEDLITIDVTAASGNNTLQSIRDAINAADAGVQSSIVFDGTDYVLTVSSKETGTANALTITDTTDLDLDEAANLVSTAENATLTVDGIAVTSSTNRLIGTIPGVTLELLAETEAATSITVEIAQDESRVVDSVQDLLGEYNDLVDFFNLHNDRNFPGVLAGDSTLQSVQSRINALIVGGVEGIPTGTIRSLSAVGVTFDGKTGKATLNAGTLSDLLETNFDEIGDLFLSAGRPTDARIQFQNSTSVTKPGDYAVTISQAAEQATVAGSTVITSLGQNEALTIVVGSDSTTVNLTAGQNITQIVDAINAELRDAGVAATAFSDGGILRVSSRDYGAAAEISVTSDIVDPADGTGSGFTTTAATDSGLDVAGQIGGVAAVGLGQLLTGAADEDFAGLALKITASAADVVSSGGDFGTVSFSRGLVDSLLKEIDSLTQYGAGALDLAREGLDNSIKRFADDIANFERRMGLRETRLLRTFAAAENAIALLKSQQASLGSLN